MKRFLPVLTCCCLFALVGVAFGQGQYRPYNPSGMTGYEWRYPQWDQGRIYLYQVDRFGRSHQVGGYCTKGQHYRPYDAELNTWGDVAPCPVALPGGVRKRVENFGVQLDKLDATAKYKLHTQHGVREVTVQEAGKLVQEGLPEDAEKPRITVIGTDSERKPVLDDLQKTPDLTKDCVIRGYKPDHWAIQGCGYQTDGHPTIYMQAPTGTVLHRQDDYQGGAQPTIEALRKAKKNYDPKKDRDMRKQSSLPMSIQWAPLFHAITAGLSGVLLGEFPRVMRS